MPKYYTALTVNKGSKYSKLLLNNNKKKKSFSLQETVVIKMCVKYLKCI